MNTAQARSAGSTRPLGTRARALAALGAAGVALIAATPAHAADDAPVDKDGNKACGIVKGMDANNKPIVVWVDHGGKKTNPDGTRWVCENGNWVGTKLTAATRTFGGTSATTYDATPAGPTPFGGTAGSVSQP